ncbi:pH-dependent sodium/proton antiporter [Hyphomicrobium denitrificans 1NES1]|uniref:Na(+)/H(+) antiporter NhaA n=1 Tax=Hyphomicrobium denitrificans 1NES1 TaxID=670307 RepID=N0BGN5_9HYPH|nr:Na+/H+ antiporter NhaA [Hyphomicrobium denitrificans]AGK59581.1 pH-dependent sodium/proton antiporter [Hyphomicrobium denitrificans 1NES1]
MKPETTATGVSREAAAGLALLGAAVLALIAANSAFNDDYERVLALPVSIGVTPFVLSKSLLHWINDALMVVFFFVVGLEIKREILRGALSNRRAALLPVIAALGGMIAPSLIYAAINWDNSVALKGWAIPAATDIAFVVGVLAVLGSRVPQSLKVFLLALAIIDDLGAILIIAFFYTGDLSFSALALAFAGVAGLALLNHRNVMRVWAYVLVGAFVWLCVLKSGVHATLAGVATALAVPLRNAKGQEGPLENLEHRLAPWVSFLILPIFAFANAGISFSGISVRDFTSPISLGIALGLIIGKPLGIYGFARAAIRSGLGARPNGATEMQLFGTAILGGIGFTMSLFIGMLAFPDPQTSGHVKLGVLTGSSVSAILGYIVLLRTNNRLRKGVTLRDGS